MTQEEKNATLYKIEVMQAYVDGEAIECRYISRNYDDEAWEKVGNPVWNWACFDYRISPEEEERAIKDAEREMQNLKLQEFFGNLKYSK